MVACLLMGLWGPVMFSLMPKVTGIVLGSAALTGDAGRALLSYRNVFMDITLLALALIAVIAVLACLRHWLMSGKIQAEAVTWDCAYLAPTARMQYTASSFAHPITKFFRTFLRTTRNVSAPEGLFPESASFSSETKDFYREQVYKPAFQAMESWLSKFRQIQHGQLNLYIMYIILALIVLFVWKLR